MDFYSFSRIFSQDFVQGKDGVRREQLGRQAQGEGRYNRQGEQEGKKEVAADEFCVYDWPCKQQQQQQVVSMQRAAYKLMTLANQSFTFFNRGSSQNILGRG